MPLSDSRITDDRNCIGPVTSVESEVIVVSRVHDTNYQQGQHIHGVNETSHLSLRTLLLPSTLKAVHLCFLINCSLGYLTGLACRVADAVKSSVVVAVLL